MTHLTTTTIACQCQHVCVCATPTCSVVPMAAYIFIFLFFGWFFFFCAFLREFPALSLLSIFIASASLIIFGGLYNMQGEGRKREMEIICEVTAHLGNVNKSASLGGIAQIDFCQINVGKPKKEKKTSKKRK